jgi:hypothetical protein
MKWRVWLTVLGILTAFLLLIYAVNYAGEQGKAQNTILQDFIGNYYLGDGMDTNFSLSIQPSLQFSVTTYMDIGNFTEYDGNVIIANGQAHLITSNSILKIYNLRLMRTETHSLIPVKWGPRKYLVFSDRLKDFCQYEPRGMFDGFFYIRSGDTHLDGWEWLKSGDWNKPASGRPTLSDGKTFVCL